MENYYSIQTERVKQHSVFRHYTTIDTLLAILKSKKLRLSPLSKLNDPLEERHTALLHQNKYFVTCFSHELRESIPMWRIYCQGARGICLEFHSLDFATDMLLFSAAEQEQLIGWEFRHTTAIDVKYCDDLNMLVKTIDPLDDGIGVSVPAASGYAKTRAWQYENETRIIAYIDVVKGNPSRFYDQENWPDNNNPKTYNYPKVDFIYVDISHPLLKDVSIIINPFISEAQRETIRWVIMKLCPSISIGRIRDSELTNMIF